MDVHEHDFQRKPGTTLECSCGTSKRPFGDDPEQHVSQDAEARFLALAAKHPIDSDLMERARLYEGEPLPLGQLFIGVAGHHDDDECTYRADGTDETYCGEPEHNHESHDPESGVES